MKKIGLRFLLEAGQFLQVVVDEVRAIKILETWVQTGISSDYKFSNMGDNDGSGIFWVVRIGSIQAIHTFDADSLQREQSPQLQPTGPVWTPPNTGFRSN